MLRVQLRARGIVDERVLAAMAAVPRERFVPEGKPRPRVRGPGGADRRSPDHQPALDGRVHDAVAGPAFGRPRPGDRDGLRLPGCHPGGDGLRRGGVERLADLADAARERLDALGYGSRVEIRVTDGGLGWPKARRGPGSPWPPPPRRSPTRWRSSWRTAVGSVIPVGGRWEQQLLLVERRGAALATSKHGPCVFVPLRGAAGWE